MTGPTRTICLFLAASCLRIEAPLLYAQTPPSGTARLQFIAVLSRHGVRSPLWTAAQLNAYSTEPWPKWDVPVGDLTPRGGTLMKLLGAYDRQYLISAGLLGPNGCADADRFYFWSDTTKRDVESGRALATGMLPGCTVAVHTVPKGADPLFSPQAAGVGKTDPGVAAAAISGRIGGRPPALVDTYRAGLEAMQRVLLGCKPGDECPPRGKKVGKLLLEQPSAVRRQSDGLADLSGPLNAAATVAESFLLEYTDGMKEQDVGWGRVNKSNLRDMMLLQETYNDFSLRTPYLARARGSNLLSHMLRSMQQAVRGEAVRGALGKLGDSALFVLGHDSDISGFGGMLGISWLLEDYQPNCRPPGGALVFEIWRDTASGKRTVRTYFRSQTLDQMRQLTALSLEAPPSRAAIFIPGCSTASEGWACDWDAFQRAAEAAIDPAFVSPDAPQASPPRQ
jgi:4-phytase/acid phosphatase